LTKKGLEMSEYQYLLTHLRHDSDFTVSNDRTLARSSSGRVNGNGMLGSLIGAVRHFDKGALELPIEAV
jgi:hypothetical protein